MNTMRVFTESNLDSYSLLIWEVLSEEVQLYLLPNSFLDSEDIAVLQAAQGSYINSVVTSPPAEVALDKINSAVCKKAEHVNETFQGTRWAQRYSKYLWAEYAHAPIKRIVTCVYRAGFML